MAFEWKESLDLARLVQHHCSKAQGYGFTREAVYRCCINRAYYAAFCHAMHYAHKNLRYPIKGDKEDHGALRNHLRKKKKGDAADWLSDLYEWREFADYKPGFDDERDLLVQCNDSIKFAQKVINDLK